MRPGRQALRGLHWWHSRCNLGRVRFKLPAPPDHARITKSHDDLDAKWVNSRLRRPRVSSPQAFFSVRMAPYLVLRIVALLSPGSIREALLTENTTSANTSIAYFPCCSRRVCQGRKYRRHLVCSRQIPSVLPMANSSTNRRCGAAWSPSPR